MRRAMLLLIATAFAVGPLQASEPQPAPLPAPPGRIGDGPSYHSSDRTVELLSAYLQLPMSAGDPMLRERIVLDLGRGRNANAVNPLRHCLSDDSWLVRAATVQALSHMPLYWIEPELRTALADPDPRVQATAVRSAVALGLRNAGEDLARLAGADDQALAVTTLNAMTELELAAPSGVLTAAVTGPNAPLAQAAIRNAPLHDELPPAWRDAVRNLAEDENAPLTIRAAALREAGRLNGANAATILRTACGSPNFVLRAAAVEALGDVGPDTLAVEMLSDPAGPVRRAACLAVVRTGDPAAADALWTVLTDTIEVNRQAARDALAVSRAEGVDTGALNWLEQYGTRMLNAGLPRRLGSTAALDLRKPELAEPREQTSHAAFILGKRRSAEALPMLAALLTELPDADEVHIRIARAMEQLGDPSATAALDEHLDHAFETARIYYATIRNLTGPAVLFNEESFAAALRARGLLAPSTAAPRIEQAVSLLINECRMPLAAGAALDVFEARRDSFEPSFLDETIAAILSDSRFGPPLRHRAAVMVGRWEFDGPATLQALRDMVRIEHSRRELIYAAAWALQECTGRAPHLTEPRVIEPPDITVVSME